MVICAVDYRQPHIFTGKLLRCLKPAKACTNNDDLRRFACVFPSEKSTVFDSPAPASDSGVWRRRHTIKRLSLRPRELTFSPYAEAHCTQQNAQISGETL